MSKNQFFDTLLDQGFSEDQIQKIWEDFDSRISFLEEFSYQRDKF